MLWPLLKINKQINKNEKYRKKNSSQENGWHFYPRPFLFFNADWSDKNYTNKYRS